jgi:hypothetical protein
MTPSHLDAARQGDMLPLMLLASTLPVVSTSATGVYNSSQTPSNLPWDSYNYCNAPHVNGKHYVMPPQKGVELVYLNSVMRHHKVSVLSFALIAID